MEPSADKFIDFEKLMGEMGTDNNEFMKQLSGSGVANLLTIFALLVVWIVKNKCKHSQCESDTSCCKCKVKEDSDDSIREEVEGEMRTV